MRMYIRVSSTVAVRVRTNMMDLSTMNPSFSGCKVIKIPMASHESGCTCIFFKQLSLVTLRAVFLESRDVWGHHSEVLARTLASFVSCWDVWLEQEATPSGELICLVAGENLLVSMCWECFRINLSVCQRIQLGVAMTSFSSEEDLKNEEGEESASKLPFI